MGSVHHDKSFCSSTKKKTPPVHTVGTVCQRKMLCTVFLASTLLISLTETSGAVIKPGSSQADGEVPSRRRLLSVVPRSPQLIQSHMWPLICAIVSSRPTISLSLDVPTRVYGILNDLARAAHSQRAQAASNAKIMARVGRKK
ncbi:unnamed protein product [Lampetra planeri]